jgi:hypothetical protein
MAARKSFAELLARSRLISEGCLYEGRILEGRVVRQTPEFLHVDVGLKFPVVMKREAVKLPP